MLPNSVSLNLSFPQKLDSQSTDSIIFIRKSKNIKVKHNTNMENYPNKYYKNENYIMTNLYQSIKENMQKKRAQKEKNAKSNKKLLSLRLLEKLVHKSFMRFYNDDAYYNIIKIDEIINNEKSHLVAEFKDFLVMGDTGEFILKYYKRSEIKKIYKQILDYYNENLFIFPNYVALYESKYIYNNIQKKQKIIDIQEELNDNKKEVNNNKKDKKGDKDSNPVFSVKEIESILNETNSSGIRNYFGINEDNTENGIDKNEKQILKIVDQINILEKNIIDKQKKEKNKIDKQKEEKNNIAEEKTINKSNGIGENNLKEKKTSKIINQKEKVIKGRNEKINLYNHEKVKSIYEMKLLENKTIKQSSHLSQPNLYLKNKKNKKIIFMNPLLDKNNSKEKTSFQREKIIENDIKMSDIESQVKKKIIENLYQKDNSSLLNKIINNTKNFSVFQDNYDNSNNGMNKSNNKIIIINKSILKEINNYKNKSKTINAASSGKNKNYKKELMNILLSSKSVLSNSKNLKYKESKNCNTSRAEKNFFTSTITDDKSTIMTKKLFLKSGRNCFNYNKENVNSKNNLSNSTQNILKNTFVTRNKKLNFNKTNIDYFTNMNVSYKLAPNNITGNKNLQQQKSQRKKNKNDWLIGSYSAKEINKKTLRKSSDSFGLKLLQRNQVKYRNNGNNLKSRLILGKSPFQNMNKKDSVNLTDRKTKEQINNNLEKIDALSRNIRKIKENLKKTVDINKYNLSSVLLSNKSKIIISKNDNKNFIDYNDNIIKVYLMNKTRNKKGNNSTSNNANLPSFKVNKIKFNSSSGKEKESEFKKKINYKTINYSNSSNNIKINSKNTIDMFKEFTIKNYNKK